MIRLSMIACLALALAATMAGTGNAVAADKLKFGMLRVPNATFIGIERGFFNEQNLEIEVIYFRSGAELVPSLSTGQIDIAATTAGAALYNSIAQGVKVKIVADYQSVRPDEPSGSTNWIVVRKALIDSGAFKTPADAKGKAIAITARGQITHFFAGRFLESAGLTEKDARLVTMSYPDMLAAFKGGSIDVAMWIDPFMTIGEQNGFSKRFMSVAEIMPDLTIGVVMFGERLAERDRKTGERFMAGLHKANRWLRANINDPAGRKEIAKHYQKHIPVEDITAYERVAIGVGRESLAPNVDGTNGLRVQRDWYAKQGLIPKVPDLKDAVDLSFTQSLN
ncbi:MAG: ABC transporter substrate-binding protein [Burkholderiales bacterium]